MNMFEYRLKHEHVDADNVKAMPTNLGLSLFLGDTNIYRVRKESVRLKQMA